MADEVAKLYASIGFKINPNDIRNVKNQLRGFANELKEFNNSAKEFAKQNGFSQYQKQRDKERKAEEKAQKDAYKERIKTDRLIAKHEEQQNKIAEKNARERTARLKRMADGFKSFAISVSNALVGGAQGILALTGESRQRALNIRDFQFETGVGLEDFNRLRRQFNIIGSRLKPEDIMSDIASVQQNLVDIAFGKGNLSGYKLTGVRAAAEGGRGNPLRVIEELRKVAQTQDIDNATLVNIMRDMGIKNAGQWLLNFRNVKGDDDRTKQSQISALQTTSILQAEISLRQFDEAIRNVKDQITADISPLFKEIVDKWKKGFEDFSISMKKGGEETEGWRKSMDALMKTIDLLGSALGKTVDFIMNTALPAWIKFWEYGLDIQTKSTEEAREEVEKQNKTLLEWGRSGALKNLVEENPIDEAMAESLFGKGVSGAKNFYNLLDNKDKIRDFNTNRKIGDKVNINQVDAHTNNVTINGVFQDELKDEMVNAIEEHEKKSDSYNLSNRVSDINQLYALGRSVGASVGGGNVG